MEDGATAKKKKGGKWLAVTINHAISNVLLALCRDDGLYYSTWEMVLSYM